MLKRAIITLCCIVLVIALAIEIGSFLTLSSLKEQYEISSLTLISIFVTRPIALSVIGFLISYSVFRNRAFRNWKICLGVGAIIILAYCVLIAIYFAQIILPKYCQMILLTLTRYPLLFMIPGILIGIGCRYKKSST